jgi:hypothetical protein
VQDTTQSQQCSLDQKFSKIIVSQRQQNLTTEVEARHDGKAAPRQNDREKRRKGGLVPKIDGVSRLPVEFEKC